jgi:hypothetical protein
MLTTVQFNDQFYAGRAEINNEGSNRMLPPEMDIFHLVRPQVMAQTRFSICLVVGWKTLILLVLIPGFSW